MIVLLALFRGYILTAGKPGPTQRTLTVMASVIPAVERDEAPATATKKSRRTSLDHVQQPLGASKASEIDLVVDATPGVLTAFLENQALMSGSARLRIRIRAGDGIKAGSLHGACLRVPLCDCVTVSVTVFVI